MRFLYILTPFWDPNLCLSLLIVTILQKNPSGSTAHSGSLNKLFASAVVLYTKHAERESAVTIRT